MVNIVLAILAGGAVFLAGLVIGVYIGIKMGLMME